LRDRSKGFCSTKRRSSSPSFVEFLVVGKKALAGVTPTANRLLLDRTGFVWPGSQTKPMTASRPSSPSSGKLLRP
jgi:hypothetical protein